MTDVIHYGREGGSTVAACGQRSPNRVQTEHKPHVNCVRCRQTIKWHNSWFAPRSAVVPQESVPNEVVLGQGQCSAECYEKGDVYGSVCTLPRGHQSFKIDMVEWRHCSHGTVECTVWR